MSRCLFFSLPSISVNKTLGPVLDQLAASGHEVIYYNTRNFPVTGSERCIVKDYPDYSNGYNTKQIPQDISYFQFAGTLADTADCLIDFLLEAVERENPDFILHSHLAFWGKLVARYFQLPAINLASTFFLDERIMLPYFRNQAISGRKEPPNVEDTIAVYRKLLSLNKRLKFTGKPDIWDVYVNKEELNLAFIPTIFQPSRTLLGNEYIFPGFVSKQLIPKKKKELIYVSMGTVMNKDLSFYQLCIDALKSSKYRCILSIGESVNKKNLGELPSHIEVVSFVDQAVILQETAIFITRGGMASVQEAVCTMTPMIVIPLIPEQRITASIIEDLGIGIQILPECITEESLRNAIHTIAGSSRYNDCLHELSCTFDKAPASAVAVDHINSYLCHGTA